MSSALIAADYVLAPIELENYSLDGITKMLQTIVGIKQKFNPGLHFLGMLPNRVKGTSPRQKEALASLLSS
ncbi:ParA family protein, partial [Acinetobacter baumannii]